MSTLVIFYTLSSMSFWKMTIMPNLYIQFCIVFNRGSAVAE